MANPSYRNSTSGSNAGGSSPVSTTVPSGTVSGDIMVAVVFCSGAVTITPPAGWTQLDVAFSAGPSIGTWYRVAGGSEPGSYSWTYSGTPTAIAVIYTAQGGDGALPVDAHSAFHRRVSSLLITGDSITPTRAGSLVLHVGVAGSATTVTVPSGFTDRQHPTLSGTVLTVSELAGQAASATGAKDAVPGASSNTQGALISIPPVASLVHKGLPIGAF